MKKFVPRLTYANVVATMALFIALGGAGYAAIKLPRNSVGTRQLKDGAVTGAKIKKGAVTAASIAPGAIAQTPIDPTTLGTVPNATHAASADTAAQAVHATAADTATRAGQAASADTAAHATSADDATNAATLDGRPASVFAPADVVRSAVVEGGIVVASESVGISQSNVVSFEPGVYCIEGLKPAPITAVVGNAFGPREIYAQVVNFSINPEGTCQVYIETRDNNTNRIPGTFAILIR